MRRARARLDREKMSAVVLLEGSEVFERSWPELAAWFHEHRFEPHEALHVGDRIQLWMAPLNSAPRVDGETRLPCYTSGTLARSP
jgi:hypothetical protein